MPGRQERIIIEYVSIYIFSSSSSMSISFSCSSAFLGMFDVMIFSNNAYSN
ncbi:hypothetical protein LguiA_002526 [Lonicera macranthoides]